MMRKLFNILFLIIILLSVANITNAQWYERKCGVMDMNSITSEEFNCLSRSSTNIVKIGRTTSVVGTAFILAGGVTMIAADPCCSSGVFLYGYASVLTGLIIDIIGIPIWVIGAKRYQNVQQYSLAKTFQKGSISIFPGIERNNLINAYSFGITASLRF